MRFHPAWTMCAIFALGLFIPTLSPSLADASGASANPASWREPYAGDDAAGPDVIAFWAFDADKPETDATGQFQGKLRDADKSRFDTDKRFGHVLTIDADTADKPQGLAIADHDALSPAGAFTLEAWIRPAKGFADRPMAYLLDKKLFHYQSDNARANRDYLMLLTGQAGQWQRSLMVSLGFGDSSESYTSQAITLQADQWTHVAFSYDGQGLGVFYVNGQPVGQKQAKARGAIAPGHHPLVIGDRLGSTHHRFVGAIAQVRLSRVARVLASGQANLTAPPARLAFMRMEQDATLPLRIDNASGMDLHGVTLETTLGDQPLHAMTIGELPRAAERDVALPIDTTLAAGPYTLRARLMRDGQPISDPLEVTIQLANRTPAGQMPIVMWGNGHADRIQAMGFNHALVHLADHEPTWSDRAPAMDKPDIQRRRLATLDDLLIHQMGGVKFFNTVNWLKRQAKGHADPQDNITSYVAVDRDGRPYEYGGQHVLDPSFPRLVEHVHHMGRRVAMNYGSHPALVGALIHSEVRDSTQISHHPHNKAAYRAATGQADYPANLGSPRGTHHRQIPHFPANRVVPDNHPLLTFYRWFWKDGDGWNNLHASAARGFKQSGRDDQWTFYDPAVRVPSLYGSGGEVDVISQWTYTYPDPAKIGLATDELFAMAQGRPGQKVMTMTQAIWYRSQTAPIAKPGQADAPAPVAWETQNPAAQYITIAPDIARQSLWLMLSRPVRGIMFHGLESLLPKAVHGGWQASSYIYTNEQTHLTLGHDMRRFVHPLGATLMQVDDPPADIAFLESFTSQMFAGRGGYGWANGWSADSYLILQWARLQPAVIYEQTLLDKGLDAYKVLVLTDCDVLTRSVVAAILRWQNKGGIVIGDERLTPAIQPDVVLPAYRRTGVADVDKAALLKGAAQLRQELEGHYQRHVDSSSPELLVRARQWQAADYLFVINDHRTYGDYVGHHRKVMEKGLPQSGTMSVARDAGVVYDVLASQRVQTTKRDGRLHWPVALDAGDGKLFLVTPQAISAVTLAGPAQAQAGAQVTWQVSVVDALGDPVPAVLPVRVDILSADGQPAEFTGDHAAIGGRLTLTLDIPANAAAGQWTVRVRDLASGQTATQTFAVTAK